MKAMEPFNTSMPASWRWAWGAAREDNIMAGTLVVTYKGVGIYVNSAGEFSANRNSEEIKATSMAAVKKKLDTMILYTPVKIMYLSDDHTTSEIIAGPETSRSGYARTTFRLPDGRVRIFNTPVALYDEQVAAEWDKMAADFTAREVALEKERKDARAMMEARITRITADELLERLGVK